MSADDKITLTFDQAVSLLPEGNYIHNYAAGRGMLLGIDYERADALKSIKEAIGLELGGPQCQSFGHALVCWHTEKRYTFFQTDKDKVRELEAKLTAEHASDRAAADFIQRRCERFSDGLGT